MVSFDLSNPFTFSLKDGDTETTINGTFRELTKAERISLKQKSEKIEAVTKKAISLLDKKARNERLITVKEKSEDWKGVEKLIIEVNKMDEELQTIQDTFDADKEKESLQKESFELRLGGQDRAQIMELAEAHGYDAVISVIVEAIQEAKAGK